MMPLLQSIFQPITQLVALGGPVLAILVFVSVFTLALVIYKTWQFRASGVGRTAGLRQAISAWDRGDQQGARAYLAKAGTYLGEPIRLGMELVDAPQARERMEAEAERAFAPLEKGFRILDMVAQLAPLLGLFGTVLGMIEAFQALQAAGSQVDPSILAGGIWVALMTTAAGLAVAMPTSMALSWLEARIDQDRGIAEHAIGVLLAPSGRAGGLVQLTGEEHVA